MKKLILGIGVIFLCACSKQVAFRTYPEEKLNINKVTQELDFEYKNEIAEFNNSFPYAYDARGKEIKTFVPGDVFDSFYIDDINDIDHILIHKAYILELDKVNNNYYSSKLEQNIDISNVRYCILDEENHYKVNENLEYSKIYVTISEDDFVNKEYNVKSIYTFNPRKDNTLLIKNVTYDRLSFDPHCTSNEFKNDHELVSQVTIYYSESSSSRTHKVKRVELEDNQLYIYVDDNYPLIGDCSMAYWEINIEFEKIPQENISINIYGF